MQSSLYPLKFNFLFKNAINLRGASVENANKYLTKKYLPRGYNSKDWKIKNVDKNGNLRLYNDIQEKVLKRF